MDLLTQTYLESLFFPPEQGDRGHDYVTRLQETKGLFVLGLCVKMSKADKGGEVSEG